MRGPTTALQALSVIYVMCASAFSVAIALKSEQPWARGIQHAVAVTVPYVRMAAGTVAVSTRDAAVTVAVSVRNTAVAVNARAAAPALAWAERKDREFFDWMASRRVMVARVLPVTRPHAAPVVVAAKAPPVTIRPKVVAAAPPTALRPAMELAQQAPLGPAPDASPPSPQELSRVLSHLKVSLTKELYNNFSLFLYVSKADHGPWAQRMYVFQKQASGNLDLLYSFPVSTGREMLVAGPSGRLLGTDTPPGYYQLDPNRMYRRYHSHEWDQPMPYAMFFNWEHDGLETGLAIHAATGADIAELGKRGSAGCVRLNPQNARLLFNLIRKNYKGLAPRFAYDRRTASMANDGLLMHDKAGNLEYAEGYKVLVLIENDGGDNIVAALF